MPRSSPGVAILPGSRVLVPIGRIVILKLRETDRSKTPAQEYRGSCAWRGLAESLALRQRTHITKVALRRALAEPDPEIAPEFIAMHIETTGPVCSSWIAPPARRSVHEVSRVNRPSRRYREIVVCTLQPGPDRIKALVNTLKCCRPPSVV